MFDIIGVFRLKEYHIYKVVVHKPAKRDCSLLWKEMKGIETLPESCVQGWYSCLFPALKRDERDWDHLFLLLHPLPLHPVPCSEKRWKGLRHSSPFSADTMFSASFPALKRDERDWDEVVVNILWAIFWGSLLWKEMKGIETPNLSTCYCLLFCVPCSEKRWKGLRHE